MKFIASKKLSDNSVLRVVILWMLIALILAMGLSITAKAIDYGISPVQWSRTILGNPNEFIEPLVFNDLLLSIHTDLFGFIITFILIASIYARTSRSTRIKIGFFTLSLVSLLLYPLALLSSPLSGSIGVTIAFGLFLFFHNLIILGSVDLIILLIRKKL
ncbi:MAG: hypothetical protein PHQ22_03305 [Sulfuricurvum sp.]|nr:hypothetical protein [Sulfuricurvum sp.]MDD5386202.1 hypothetical protein [Sulfuricurvum sp.]